MLAAPVLFSGCESLLIAKRRVMVDALSAPAESLSTAPKSYRLTVNKNLVSHSSLNIAVVAACINAALTGKGLFEAPTGLPSDVFIDVAFGAGVSASGDPKRTEVYLRLAARPNSTKALERSKEDEIWDVKVSIDGVDARRAESAIPLLCVVAADYLGKDTQIEAAVEVPINSPSVKAVREQAMKTLQTQDEERAARRLEREAAAKPEQS